MEYLDWYHGDLSRHIAEALLMANGREGSFLARRACGSDNDFCLSVRGRNAVKHFIIEVTGTGVTFAYSEFECIEELVKAFANQVILCSQAGTLSKNIDNGTLITLKYPYPKCVAEPDTYDEIMMLHSTIKRDATLDDLRQSTVAVPLASKSGFLTKQGGSYKSWKTRWFVVVRNEFSYYEDRSTERPIKTLNLEECFKWAFCDIPGRSNCFFLEFPNRTWYFSANSVEDMNEWTSIIDWKMKHNNSK